MAKTTTTDDINLPVKPIVTLEAATVSAAGKKPWMKSKNPAERSAAARYAATVPSEKRDAARRVGHKSSGRRPVVNYRSQYAEDPNGTGLFRWRLPLAVLAHIERLAEVEQLTPREYTAALLYTIFAESDYDGDKLRERIKATAVKP